MRVKVVGGQLNMFSGGHEAKVHGLAPLTSVRFVDLDNPSNKRLQLPTIISWEVEIEVWVQHYYRSGEMITIYASSWSYILP